MPRHILIKFLEPSGGGCGVHAITELKRIRRKGVGLGVIEGVVFDTIRLYLLRCVTLCWVVNIDRAVKIASVITMINSNILKKANKLLRSPGPNGTLGQRH